MQERRSTSTRPSPKFEADLREAGYTGLAKAITDSPAVLFGFGCQLAQSLNKAALTVQPQACNSQELPLAIRLGGDTRGGESPHGEWTDSCAERQHQCV